MNIYVPKKDIQANTNTIVENLSSVIQYFAMRVDSRFDALIKRLDEVETYSTARDAQITRKIYLWSR